MIRVYNKFIILSFSIRMQETKESKIYMYMVIIISVIKS